LAIYVPKAVGRGKLWPVIRHGDFDLREVRAKEALVVLDQYRRPDGPSENGNPYELGLVGAFELSPEVPKEPLREGRHRSLMRVDFLQIDKVRYEMRFPGFSVIAKDARVQGSVTSYGRTLKKKPEVYFDAKVFIPEGVLDLKGRKFAFKDVDVVRASTLPETPKDLYLKLRSGVVQSARLSGEARLVNLYGGGARGIDGSLTVGNLGPLLSLVSDGKVFGEDAKFVASAVGPFNDLDGQASVSGLQGKYGKIRADDFSAKVLIKDKKLRLERAGVKVLDGKLAMKGDIDLRNLLWRGSVTIKNLSPDGLMDKDSRVEWGGVVNGEVTASGEAPKPIVNVEKLKLNYALNKPLKGIGRVLHATGRVGIRGPEINVHELDLEAGYFTLASRGKLHATNQRLSMAVTATGRKLRKVMGRMDMPGVVESAKLKGRVGGRFKQPYFNGSLEADGLGHRPHSRGRLESSVSFSHGTLGFKKIRAYVYRGGIFGDAGVRLYSGKFENMYSQPRIRTDLGFSGLSLRSIIGGRQVRGRVKGGLRVSGPLSGLRGRFWGDIPKLMVKSQKYENGKVEVAISRGDYLLEYAGIEHAKGGRVRAWGAYRKGGGISLTAQLEKLPLAGIPGLTTIAPDTIAGLLDGRVEISGSQSWPILAGSIELLKAKVRGIYMGSTKVDIKPEAKVSDISGELFGHFKLSGEVALKPKPLLNLEVTFDKFPLEKLLPEMKEVANAQGHVSGKLEIALDQGGVKNMAAQLDELRVTMLQKSLDPLSPPEEFHIHNEKPILLAYNGQKLKIGSFHLTGAAGDFTLTGWASENNSDIRLNGSVGLKPLELFVREHLDELKGDVLANIKITGDLSKPRLAGSLKMKDASILLAERQQRLEFPSGTLRIRDKGKGWDRISVTLQRLMVKVGEEALYADGTLSLSEWKPERFALRLKGYLSGKALEIAAPKYVSHAHGKTKIDLQVSGTPEENDIKGTAVLERTEIALRGVRSHVVLESGELGFEGGRLTVNNFRGRIDDGYISGSGHIGLKGMQLAEVDLKISAQNIPYREPRVYEVEFGANIRVTGDREGMTVSGQVDLVDGRYVQKFDVVKQAFLKRRVSEASASSWKDNKTLANLALNLSVSTAGNIYIQNNIADMNLDGSIYVGGTLADPQLGGQIQVDEGNFRIPFMRGKYQVQKGIVDFNRGEEPYLDLSGETTVRDRTDTEHLVTLTLTGFLSEIRIDFTSDTNLPKSQILLLLASGRTTDSLRQDFKGARDTGPGTGRGGGALDVYDPMLKQVSGDFLSDLVAKPIKDITRMDLFRLELGTSAVQFRMEKRLGKYFKLIGETEFGLMGRQRQEGRLEGQFHDNIYFDVKGRRLIPGEDVFEEEDPLQGRIQLRYRLRFKGSLVRSLGF